MTARARSYDTWESYFLPESIVLQNRLGATTAAELQTREANITHARIVQALIEPEMVREGGRVDASLLRRIHAHVFSDIYDWAGDYRRVPMGKGDTWFTEPQDIAPRLEDVFRHLSDANGFRGASREGFCECLAGSFNAVNSVHAFREGNGRAQQLLWTYVAQDAGFDLDWTRISRDQMYLASADAASSKVSPRNERQADTSGLVQMLKFASDPSYDFDPLPSDRVNTRWMAERYLQSLGFGSAREGRVREGGQYTGLVVAASPYHFALETGRGGYAIFDNTREKVAVEEIVGIEVGRDDFRITRIDDDIENAQECAR